MVKLMEIIQQIENIRWNQPDEVAKLFTWGEDWEQKDEEEPPHRQYPNLEWFKDTIHCFWLGDQKEYKKLKRKFNKLRKKILSLDTVEDIKAEPYKESSHNYKGEKWEITFKEDINNRKKQIRKR